MAELCRKRSFEAWVEGICLQISLYFRSRLPRSGWPYRYAFIHACMLQRLLHVVAAHACYECYFLIRFLIALLSPARSGSICSDAFRSIRFIRRAISRGLIYFHPFHPIASLLHFAAYIGSEILRCRAAGEFIHPKALLPERVYCFGS